MSAILVSLKIAVFLSILGIATMEILMNKKKTSKFGLILMALSFLLASISELLFLTQEQVGFNIAIVDNIFFILGGIGLIFYFSGLKSHK